MRALLKTYAFFWCVEVSSGSASLLMCFCTPLDFVLHCPDLGSSILNGCGSQLATSVDASIWLNLSKPATSVDASNWLNHSKPATSVDASNWLNLSKPATSVDASNWLNLSSCDAPPSLVAFLLFNLKGLRSCVKHFWQVFISVLQKLGFWGSP